MLSKGVSILTVHSKSLEEEQCKESTCDQKDYVADQVAKKELTEDDQAETYEFVPSVTKQLKERWSIATTSKA